MARGRPSSFKPTHIAQAEKLCALGATDREIAEFFDVTEATLYRWQHQFPELCDALKVAKESADERVTKSLYRRALGYSHDATKIFQYEGEPVTVDYVEHYPPDTTACIFWLKNRRPDLWREVSDKNVNFNVASLAALLSGGSGAGDTPPLEEEPETIRH